VAPVWLALACGAVSVAAASAGQSTQPQRATCANGDSKAAIAACTSLLERGNLDDESKVITYVNRGNAYDNLQDSDRAVKDYDSALAINPRDARAHRNKGVTLNRQGLLREALQEFDKAIELQPDQAFAYASRGGNLRAQAELSASEPDRRGLYERARADYDQTIKLGGLGQREAVAYWERGLVNHSLNQLDAAIADFTKAIELAPDYGLAYDGRADSLRVKARLATSEPERTSQYERAVADYDKAIRLAGLGQRNALAYFNRGVAHYYLSHFDAAIADFTNAIELAQGLPLLPAVYSARALAYADNQDFNRASADVEKASAITNDATVARQLKDVRDYVAQKRK
jgi:tetratricopeptide (TPR) repeat protein